MIREAKATPLFPSVCSVDAPVIRHLDDDDPPRYQNPVHFQESIFRVDVMLKEGTHHYPGKVGIRKVAQPGQGVRIRNLPFFRRKDFLRLQRQIF